MLGVRGLEFGVWGLVGKFALLFGGIGYYWLNENW